VFQEPEIFEPEPVIEENLPPSELPEASVVEAQMEEPVEAVPPPVPPTPRIIPPKKKPLIAPTAEVENPKRDKPASAARQEVLQFEPLTRGRFEKSEPTIVEGQDLDVPTFLRKNIRVK
jgi:cell division protein FtsZ